jgi:hypothetical protein
MSTFFYMNRDKNRVKTKTETIILEISSMMMQQNKKMKKACKRGFKISFGTNESLMFYK